MSFCKICVLMRLAYGIKSVVNSNGFLDTGKRIRMPQISILILFYQFIRGFFILVLYDMDCGITIPMLVRVFLLVSLHKFVSVGCLVVCSVALFVCYAVAFVVSVIIFSIESSVEIVIRSLAAFLYSRLCSRLCFCLDV